MKKLFKFPNGDKYEGDIKSGKRSGIGTYTWKDGSKYKGYWKNNKKHGYGEFKDKKGNKVTAIWKNGKFSEHVNKRALEKIDLRYLRENLNLKKFLKLIFFFLEYSFMIITYNESILFFANIIFTLLSNFFTVSVISPTFLKFFGFKSRFNVV